jgi:hypothetical protein
MDLWHPFADTHHTAVTVPWDATVRDFIMLVYPQLDIDRARAAEGWFTPGDWSPLTLIDIGIRIRDITWGGATPYIHVWGPLTETQAPEHYIYRLVVTYGGSDWYWIDAYSHTVFHWSIGRSDDYTFSSGIAHNPSATTFVDSFGNNVTNSTFGSVGPGVYYLIALPYATMVIEYGSNPSFELVITGNVSGQGHWQYNWAGSLLQFGWHVDEVLFEAAEVFWGNEVNINWNSVHFVDAETGMDVSREQAVDFIGRTILFYLYR